MHTSPKKSLGQNFLTSPLYVNTIVKTASVTMKDTVIEIGPGKGILTQALLGTAGKVIAIEKDSELVDYLKKKFRKEISEGKLELVEGDILSFDLSALNFSPKTVDRKPETEYKLVANIPYYITGAILKKFLSSRNQPESMTLLVQREVAERIIKKDGKESILSLSVEVFGKATIVKKVPPSAFSPRPSVDSSILHITKVGRPFFQSADEEKSFFKVVKTGFAHKRKTLFKNLQAIIEKNDLDKRFFSCEIEHTVRAETVPLEKWLCLIKKS